jgi:hypothetical protein
MYLWIFNKLLLLPHRRAPEFLSVKLSVNTFLPHQQRACMPPSLFSTFSPEIISSRFLDWPPSTRGCSSIYSWPMSKPLRQPVWPTRPIYFFPSKDLKTWLPALRSQLDLRGEVGKRESLAIGAGHFLSRRSARVLVHPLLQLICSARRLALVRWPPAFAARVAAWTSPQQQHTSSSI